MLSGAQGATGATGAAGTNGTNGAAGATGPAGPGVTWVDATGTSVTALSNTGYMADNAAQVTITLPASPAVGDLIQINGIGAGGWMIAQNSGQSIIAAAAENISGAASRIWTARATNRYWQSVASSSDGTHLVAVVNGGQIYTSADSGVTWTAQAAAGIDWQSVASSSDGTHLVAVAMFNGQIYTSADSGATWTAQATSQAWYSVASSSDGTHIVAADSGDRIYTSDAVTTTPGTAGSISGGQYDAIELQYIGNHTFTVLNYTGSLVVQ